MSNDADTKIPLGFTPKEEAAKEALDDLKVEEPLASIPAAPFPISVPSKDISEAEMKDFLETIKKDEVEKKVPEDKEAEPPAAFEFLPPSFPTTDPKLSVVKADAKDSNATSSVAKNLPSVVKTPIISKQPVALEASPGASGAAQVKALLGKNLLTKVRTPGATLAELISPVLLMVVLWISYNMTDTMFFPARYYHALNVDLPLFWDTGTYGEEEFDQMDISDTHRRRLGEDLEDIMQGEDETWTWSQLLKEMSSGSGSGEDQDPEEEMGLINDFFMMNQLKHGRHLQDAEDDWMTGSADWMAGSTLEDDTIDLDEKQSEDDDDDEEDSGDWYEEIMTDLKKETIDKVDWNEVVDEIQDNFGDMWDNAKDFIVVGNGRSSYSTMNMLRLRVSCSVPNNLFWVPTSNVS